MPANPFDLVFTAMLNQVAHSDKAGEFIKTGNLIRFDSDTVRLPIKENVLDADLPELILSAEGGTINLANTSCSSAISRRYAWLISTGDQRITHAKGLHAIEWLLLCLMADCHNILAALKWEGENFVKAVSIVEFSAGLSNAERNRGIQGWSALWRCEVFMLFNTRKLIDYGRA